MLTTYVSKYIFIDALCLLTTISADSLDLFDLNLPFPSLWLEVSPEGRGGLSRRNLSEQGVIMHPSLVQGSPNISSVAMAELIRTVSF